MMKPIIVTISINIPVDISPDEVCDDIEDLLSDYDLNDLYYEEPSE